MAFLKKLTIGSYLLVGAAVLAIIGLIMAGVSAHREFPLGEMPIVVTFTILAILLIAGALFAVVKFGDKPWVSAIVLAAVVLLGFCFYNVFMGRNVLMGGVWFSEPGFGDRENPIAVASLNNAVISMVFYLLAALVVGVGAFFKLAKKTENAK